MRGNKQCGWDVLCFFCFKNYKGTCSWKGRRNAIHEQTYLFKMYINQPTSSSTRKKEIKIILASEVQKASSLRMGGGWGKKKKTYGWAKENQKTTSGLASGSSRFCWISSGVVKRVTSMKSSDRSTTFFVLRRRGLRSPGGRVWVFGVEETWTT